MILRSMMTIFAVLGLLTLVGCGSREYYPISTYGWTSPDYSVVFGQLEPSAKKPGEWKILFGTRNGNNAYGGHFVVQPVGLLRGYSAGDQVEITGHPLLNTKNPTGNGTLYQMTGISLWVNVGRPSYLTR